MTTDGDHPERTPRAAPVDQQWVTLGMQNRAPTDQHPTHHVYAVEVSRSAPKPFLLVESIRGGHGDAGGSASFTLPELLAWPEWKEFFTLAGCDWAIPIIEAADLRLPDALIREADRRSSSRS